MQQHCQLFLQCVSRVPCFVSCHPLYVQLGAKSMYKKPAAIKKKINNSLTCHSTFIDSIPLLN